MDEIRDEDIEMQVIRLGDGRPCAVRVIHRPSGREAVSEDGPTIRDNRDRAMAMLKSQLG